MLLIRVARQCNLAKTLTGVFAPVALTGHLVLSTLHTNDCPGGIMRLVDMGIEPFLLTASILGFVAQRLARTICASCKTSYYPPPNLLKSVGWESRTSELFQKGEGCRECNNTGFRGRIGIYEVMLLDAELKRMIQKDPSETDIRVYLAQTGWRTLREKALDSLRRSFEGRAVFAARRASGAGSWALESKRDSGGKDSPISVNDWLRRLLDQACERRVVTVEPAPRGLMPGTVAEVMIAPVISGDILVCTLVILRDRGAPVFRASEMMLIESLTTFCGDLIRSHRLVRELREMSIAMVRALVNAVDQKDEYTCGHSLRVAYYATTLGQRLGLGEVELQMLQWAALLHDVGKIGIRDNVLKKEGKLTPEEFGHIKEHPVRSFKVVQEVPQLLQALDGILHHHERYDGSGYPAGLKGEEIPLQARIIQIADVFDALTSNRSYRQAFDWQRALDILQEEAGKTVDPQLQKTFDALIRETLASAPTPVSVGARSSAPEASEPEGVIGVLGPPTPWERMVEDQTLQLTESPRRLHQTGATHWHRISKKKKAARRLRGTERPRGDCNITSPPRRLQLVIRQLL